MFDPKKIFVVADIASTAACAAYDALYRKYDLLTEGEFDGKNADLVIVLGGDGMMLKILHRFMSKNLCFYGMNTGSIGFLLNTYREDNVLERINSAKIYKLNPLEMKVTNIHGDTIQELAINEVSLLRQSNQAARIKVKIDDIQMLDMLVCDGILVSTPAGSTAYNFAADGPILPLSANLLALTPISPFRPKRWKGGLISNKNSISFENLDAYKRPFIAVADFHETRDVVSVEVRSRQDLALSVLFDEDNNIEDRLLKEMFLP
jgi:NAD+ kinase